MKTGWRDGHWSTNSIDVEVEVPLIELWYPRLEGQCKTVEVGLMDVRAADSLRITYDFERDGWAILQASVFEWETDDKVCDEGWQEVAFIQAWGSQRIPSRELPHDKPDDEARNG